VVPRIVATAGFFIALSGLVLAACRGGEPPAGDDDARWPVQRLAMVERQIAARGVADPAVLDAMRRVPRHLFVPEPHRERAYGDHPLPIGEGQTISQPYIVALMSELLQVGPESRVLEVGTGSGYQAAVLAELCREVYSIEIVPALGRRADGLLKRLGYDNISVRIGDGYRGWPEAAPFDGIIVTAAPGHVPRPLLEQLAPGGRLVIPVGERSQWLQVYTKRVDGKTRQAVFHCEDIIPVRFVPMTGEARNDP
jgi:protein-L-isoaspartate(D-aspartate) O-methyltransferase